MQKYSRTLSGSIGSGMKSFMGGNRRYYVLEHKVSSKYHKAGENQRIIIDQIELGRDPKCQVRFDESFGTVSRRHAAIVKDGENWKLVQLSKTNTTYLNARPVEKEWYLQNGDEIQLSTNGPKIGFIVPVGEKGLVKSIGFTARMGLFGQQALRPYKQALVVLSCILVLCIAGGIWRMTALNRQVLEGTYRIASAQTVVDSLSGAISGYEVRMGDMANEIAAAHRAAHRAARAAGRAAANAAVSTGSTISSELKTQCFPHTYAIYQVREEMTLPSGEKEIDTNIRLIGTGFLLSDGRFVTSRHVVETYYYHHGNPSIDSLLILQNVLIQNGGDITTFFVAVSAGGDVIKFTNKDCKADRSSDREERITNNEGGSIVLRWAENVETDWATVKTSKRQGLPVDAAFASHPTIGTPLQVLGFPYGRGGESPQAVSPIYTQATVARDGLDVDGTIMASNQDFQPGNSGGPVLICQNGTYKVVGVLSGSTMGKGRIVSIKALR